ncbi:carboxylesterase/lipase family protein [Amycolatopsis sp. MEPSY49]|uniref:carboxylesterase/lipase family protein n=1 Tax=Amycolatopsis sp. MEPSY49 TaxID=3151600 RepID=UPI003EF45DBC
MPAQQNPVVRTPAGAVRGVRDAFGERYRAIPYALAPGGAGRFGEPAPHPGWSGVRDGTGPGPTAPQPARDFGRLDMTPYFGPGWVRGADYLTVDVRTPAAGRGQRPVMVFVHGGGFVTGSARAALYDGRAFARDGVVIVTVQYRLGVAGFLALEGAPDNRGLLDVLLALRWVQEAIPSFGGDPGNVTVFGQSAGATLIGGLLATPQAKGLFRRAIMQSGSGTGAFTPEQAHRVTTAAAAALGTAPTVEGFADIPDERFLEVLPALSGLDLRTDTATDPLVGLSPFSLVLSTQPADALTPDQVDLLVGTNTEEGLLYLVPQGKSDRTTEAEVLGDALFGTGTARMADAHARLAPGRTHVYSFGHRSTAFDGRLGAAHTVELPFVFDVADEPWLHGETGLLGPTPAPEDLARRMHGAWIEFATTGNPGWPAHTTSDPVTHRFGT